MPNLPQPQRAAPFSRSSKISTDRLDGRALQTQAKPLFGRIPLKAAAAALLTAGLLAAAALPAWALSTNSYMSAAADCSALADFETLYKDSKKPSVSIHCSYPRFTQIPDESARNRINQEIQEYADSVLVKGEILQRQTQGEVTGQLDFQVYQVLDLVSVRFEGSVIGPDNRTQQLVHAISLDPSTGQPVTLYHLWEKICFKASTTADFSQLNQIFQEKLAETGEQQKLSDPGTLPVLSHDQPFCLRDNSVVLFFEENTLFPAAMGRVELSLSIDALQQAVANGMQSHQQSESPS